jgi:hypothetical protein
MRNQFGNTPLTLESLSGMKPFPKLHRASPSNESPVKRFKDQEMTASFGGSVGKQA